MNATTNKTTSPAPGSSRCTVDGCRKPCRRGDRFCRRCLERLDESARFIIAGCLRSLNSDYIKHIPLTAAEYERRLEQYRRRLGAEFLGPLSEAEHQEADSLTVVYHSFATFTELIHAEGGYWPKFDMSSRFCPDKTDREKLATLCDYYDRVQHLRGDSRRATRIV